MERQISWEHHSLCSWLKLTFPGITICKCIVILSICVHQKQQKIPTHCEDFSRSIYSAKRKNSLINFRLCWMQNLVKFFPHVRPVGCLLNSLNRCFCCVYILFSNSNSSAASSARAWWKCCPPYGNTPLFTRHCRNAAILTQGFDLQGNPKRTLKFILFDKALWG